MAQGVPHLRFSIDAGNGRRNAMETESALTVYNYSARLQHLYLHFKR